MAQMTYDLAYANATDRNARTGSLTESDIGKIARDFDNNTFRELVSVSPVTWRDALPVSRLIAQVSGSSAELTAFLSGALIVIRTDLL